MIQINKLGFKTKLIKEITDAYVSSSVYIPLSDDEDTEGSPLIEPNTRVSEGEVLSHKSVLDAAVHCSVPGILTEYKNVSTSDGKVRKAAVIQTGGVFSYMGKKRTVKDYSNFTPAELCSALSSKGVLNTFAKPYSLGKKLYKMVGENPEPFKALGVRLFNEDPSCCCDASLSNSFPKEIAEGAQIISKILRCETIVFYYEKRLGDSGIKDFEFSKKTAYVPVNLSSYPAGTEDMLKETAKKNGKIPVPDFFVDAFTAYNVYRAIAYDEPILSRLVQVSGDAIKKSQLFWVRLGTPLDSLVKECGGLVAAPYKIVINGLINGIAVSDSKIPVTQNIFSISVLSKKSVSDQSQINCIRCGRCHLACPKGLHPDRLFSAYTYHTAITETMRKSIALCSNCGACSTVCPSRIPLRQTMNLMLQMDEETLAQCLAQPWTGNTMIDAQNYNDSDTENDAL